LNPSFAVGENIVDVLKQEAADLIED